MTVTSHNIEYEHFLFTTSQLFHQSSTDSSGIHSIPNADKVSDAQSYNGLDLYIVDKNMIQRLTANTTITGEKICIITVFKENVSQMVLLKFFNGLSPLFLAKLYANIKIGEIATTIQRNHTLITNNTAKIAIGKNKINAKNVLIKKPNKDQMAVSLPGSITNS